MSEHHETEQHETVAKKSFGNKFILPILLLTCLFVVFYYINKGSSDHGDGHGTTHHDDSHDHEEHHDSHANHNDHDHSHDHDHENEAHKTDAETEVASADGLNFEENSWAWTVQNFLANGTGSNSFTLDKIPYEGEEVSAEGKAQLDDLAALLKAYPDMKILVKGHSRVGDNMIEKKANKASSKIRALWAQGKLSNRGVSGSQMKAKGIGGDEPLAVDPKDDSQRRITIQFE